MSTGDQEPLEIRDFEIDSRSSPHFGRHGLDSNLLYELLAGDPLFFVNPPADNRSGSHLMIGPAAEGSMWTVVIVMIDDAAGIWRPITGWPSTGMEASTWHEEKSREPRNEG